MKIKELRDLNQPDLLEKLKRLKKELFDLNFQRHLGVVEKPARFKSIRHDIARIQTIIKERELVHVTNTAS